MVQRFSIIIGMILALVFFGTPGLAQPQPQPQDSPFQTLLQTHGDVIAKSSRKTVAQAIDALSDSGFDQAPTFLRKWQQKEVWRHKEDGFFVYAEVIDRDTFRAFDPTDGSDMGIVEDRPFKKVKPNSGVRGMLGAALVKFQLNASDPAIRLEALQAIQRDAQPSHLSALRASIHNEPDETIKAAKMRLQRVLTIQFDTDDAVRIDAINAFAGDLGLDVRAALTPLTKTVLQVLPVGEQPAEFVAIVTPGDDALPRTKAYELLVAEGLAPAVISLDDQKQALVENIADGAVAGIPVTALDNPNSRARAYRALLDQGLVDPTPTDQAIDEALNRHLFFTLYALGNSEVAKAADQVLDTIETNLRSNQIFDLGLDALSLASIYFLAAIGLAITFGVMRVINMAHGEFIMMGAYTGFVVQQIIPNYTASIIVALPLAFVVTFMAGVALERLVIRWLAHRPLETLLATFGISIVLQQLAKNIFGTQARPLTSPGWLDGSLVFNDVVSISYIRIAIFVIAVLLLGVFVFVLNRTRLGLEVRAVSQNPAMASSMGINPGRINMLTFGFGSGIAGVAGVAIGLYAKVTSEMGADYIVQSFMTVVVGGVGNIWGALLGASMVGSLQKVIEWFNPSNTLAAQTYMILFIILFIQIRPKGIIALKGRAAGD